MGAVRVRPEHLFVALLGESDIATQVLSDLGAPRELILAELERRRGRYLDGLGDGDAEALATIGIDLEEVLRRVDPETDEPRRPPGPHPALKGGQEGSRALAA